MNSLKCTHCGLVYIVRGDAHACPRCGTSNEPESGPPEESRGSRGALAALVCVLLLVAGGVVYYLKPARPPAYVEAIRSSEQFKQLATVRVNQAPLGPPNGGGNSSFGSLGSMLGSDRGVTFAAYVLEARGLLAFNDTTREERGTPMGGYQLDQRMGPGGVTYNHYGRVEKPGLAIKIRNLTISITPSGEKEAESWKETEEAYGGKPDVNFWRVPVGEAEFVKVGQVLDGPGEGGTRKLTVEVVWRWRPNLLGQSFDASGQMIGLLPEKAGAAAKRLGLDSNSELKALAHLEPTADGGWRVVDVKPMTDFTGDFMTVD